MDLTSFGLVVDKEKKFNELKGSIGEVDAMKASFNPDKLEKIKFHEKLHKNSLETLELVMEDDDDMEFMKTTFFINSIGQIKQSKEIINILRKEKNA